LQGDITSGLLNDLGIDGGPLGFHGGNRKRPFSAASRATRFWTITRRYVASILLIAIGLVLSLRPRVGVLGTRHQRLSSRVPLCAGRVHTALAISGASMG
jgi:hypothetical protein